MDMVKVACASPSLTIPALSVQFVDGEALVPADRLDALKAYAIHGVQVPDAPSGEQGPAKDDADDKSAEGESQDDADDTSAEGQSEPEQPAEAEKKAPAKRQTRASAKPFGN